MNYSLTQAGNVATIVGVLFLLAQAFNLNIAREEIEIAAGAVVSLIGIVSSWYGRYRIGDVKLSGFKK